MHHSESHARSKWFQHLCECYAPSGGEGHELSSPSPIADAADAVDVSVATDEFQSSGNLPAMDRSVQKRFSESTMSTKWLNDLVLRLFPRIHDHLQTVVNDYINPQLDVKLPAVLKGKVKLVKVELGDAIPHLGPIVVRDRADAGASKDDAIIIDIGINLDAEMVIEVNIANFIVGIREMKTTGTLTVALRPALERPPFFGGLELYFVNPPDIEMDFTGVVNVVNLKAIRGLIRQAVMHAFSEALVIPSRVVQDLDTEDDTDIADLKFPDPLGMVKFTLLSGKNLIAMDTSFFGDATSDPYVTVRMGRDVWQSPVQTKTCNPVWKEGATTFLSLHDYRQCIDFHVWDQDRFSADDLIGKSKKVPSDSLFKKGQCQKHEITLTLEDKEKGTTKDAGSICVATEWFEMSNARAPDQPSFIFVAMKVNDFSGLPVGSIPPYRVVAKLGKDIKVESKKSNPVDHLALKPVHQTLEVIIKKMSGKGMNIRDIADCTSLREEQVTFVLKKSANPEEAHKHLVKASLERQATCPRFDQVLRSLVPWSASLRQTNISVELWDGSGKQVGKPAQVSFDQVFRAPGMELEGPFPIVGDIEMNGAIRARWLVPSSS